MKKLTSHFRYNKRQRNGIFSLLCTIVILQIIYINVDFSDEKKIPAQLPDLAIFKKQFDSLKAVELEKGTPKIYPFNPNYITDHKGYRLGMSVSEIDRLLEYRKRGKFINSKREFQQVTKVSDSLLQKIAPYFKFPDWVVRRNQQLKKKKESIVLGRKEGDLQKRVVSTTDINKATFEDFETIKGVGKILSKRIVKYRKKLRGFTFEYQIFEVWGLEKEVGKKILTVFKVVHKPKIKKININTATFKKVLALPYIDYELCKKIFDFRDEVAELQNIEELKNIAGFPLEKYNRIVLYLFAE